MMNSSLKGPDTLNERGIKGTLTLLIVFILFMLGLWCINMYKHFSAGKWTKGLKIADIIGLILLISALVALIVPMLK